MWIWSQRDGKVPLMDQKFNTECLILQLLCMGALLICNHSSSTKIENVTTEKVVLVPSLIINHVAKTIIECHILHPVIFGFYMLRKIRHASKNFSPGQVLAP